MVGASVSLKYTMVRNMDEAVKELVSESTRTTLC